MGKEVLSFSRFIHTGGVLPPFSGIQFRYHFRKVNFAGYVWLPPGYGLPPRSFFRQVDSRYHVCRTQ